MRHTLILVSLFMAISTFGQQIKTKNHAYEIRKQEVFKDGKMLIKPLTDHELAAIKKAYKVRIKLEKSALKKSNKELKLISSFIDVKNKYVKEVKNFNKAETAGKLSPIDKKKHLRKIGTLKTKLESIDMKIKKLK